MDKPRNLSSHDERYLNSPGFEVYMIAGVIFVLGMALSFILTFFAHLEPLFWPGLILSVIVSSIVLHMLKKREYQAKLREIQQKPMEEKK
jgi:hypothetical protein